MQSRCSRLLFAGALATAACETTVNLGNGPDAGAPNDAAGTPDADTGVDSIAPPDASSADGGADAPPQDAATDEASRGGPKGFFITRATYFPDFGGIKGGDFRCQTSADAQSLGGKWKAWLSDSATDAAGRFLSDGPWIAVQTGVTLFPNRAALRGFPLAALTTDELGQPATDRWWTATLANGVRGPKTCTDWSSQSQFDGAMTGTRVPGVPGKEWTEDQAYSCMDTFALLCLEDI